MSNTLQGNLFSKGLYSSWCHMPFQDALFDAGEGAAPGDHLVQQRPDTEDGAPGIDCVTR